MFKVFDKKQNIYQRYTHKHTATQLFMANHTQSVAYAIRRSGMRRHQPEKEADSYARDIRSHVKRRAQTPHRSEQTSYILWLWCGFNWPTPPHRRASTPNCGLNKHSCSRVCHLHREGFYVCHSRRSGGHFVIAARSWRFHANMQHDTFFFCCFYCAENTYNNPRNA